MNIEGISLSEFNDKTGFQLIETIPHQSPLTNQQFNLCSDFILPREQFCQRLMAIQYKEEFFLVGVPSLSFNKKDSKYYPREKYIYAVTLLISKKSYLSSRQNIYKEYHAYDPPFLLAFYHANKFFQVHILSLIKVKCIKKIAHYFKTLQQNYHLIYNHEENQAFLLSTLTTIYRDMNTKTYCYLNYLTYCFAFINFNIPSIVQASSDQHELVGLKKMECLIPITNLSESEISGLQSTLGRQLMQYAFQGHYTIKKIHMVMKNVSFNEIFRFYRLAVEKGFVFLVGMFSLNNIYVINHKIHEFMPCCPKYHLISVIRDNIQLANHQRIQENQLLYLYLRFSRNKELKNIIQIHQKSIQKINVPKWIQYGQIFGFLTRIYKTIAYLKQQQPITIFDEYRKYLQSKCVNFRLDDSYCYTEYQKFQKKVVESLWNQQNIDQMCVGLEIDQDSLLRVLRADNRVILKSEY